MKDAALEEIWKTRREISKRFNHDTAALIAYYRELEKTKYADRMISQRATDQASDVNRRRLKRRKA